MKLALYRDKKDRKCREQVISYGGRALRAAEKKLWNSGPSALSIGGRSKTLPCLLGRPQVQSLHRPSSSVALLENEIDSKHRKTCKVGNVSSKLQFQNNLQKRTSHGNTGAKP